jgi:hypothetical protein
MKIFVFLIVLSIAGVSPRSFSEARPAQKAKSYPPPSALNCGPGHKVKVEANGPLYGQICVLEGGQKEVRDGPFELRDLKKKALVQSGNYKNGVLHGTNRFYTEDGNLESAIEFVEGVMRKQHFFAPFDEKIKIKEVTLDEKGKFYGSRFWNLKGQVITEGQFSKFEPTFTAMEEGKVEIAKLHAALQAFIAKYGTLTSDLIAMGYTPFGHRRYACGFTSASKQMVKLEKGLRPNNQRFNSMNKTFKKAAGKKFKFTGQTKMPDFPSTHITGARYKAACVGRFGEEKDAWTVDSAGKFGHESTLLN